MATAPPIRVFIAEDNPADVYLLEEAFRENGLTVDLNVWQDGDDALRFLDDLDANSGTPCPEVAVIDLHLPKVGGASLVERMRQIERCSNAQIIVLTSSGSPEERTRALALGANEYLLKPSTLEEFLKIGNVVRRLHARALAAG